MFGEGLAACAAVLSIQRRMPDEAIAHLHDALQLEPDSGAAILNLAMAYEMKDDARMARATLAVYVEHHATPDSALVQEARRRLGPPPPMR